MLRTSNRVGLRALLSAIGGESSALSSSASSASSVGAGFASSATAQTSAAGKAAFNAANPSVSQGFAASFSTSKVTEAGADLAKAAGASPFDGRLRPIPNGYMKSYWRPIPFHLVDMSPYPLMAGLGGGGIGFGMVDWMCNSDPKLLLAALGFMGFTGYGWWSEVIKEGAKGHHVEVVRNMIRLGVKLFIVSEIMVFLSFFWAWFHSALNPTIWIGNVWPPRGIEVPDALGLPLAMTLTLAASGIAANAAQLAMKTHQPHLPGGYDRAAVTKGLGTAIGLGLFFLGLQAYEYINTAFCISDSAFGTCFFMATGLHGFHVAIGVGMLTVTLIRHLRGHFKPWQHVGFEASVWYWQFVDAVWMILYAAIYVWGGSGIPGITTPATAAAH